MASFKAKFPVLQELFAKNHRGPFAPLSGARVKHHDCGKSAPIGSSGYPVRMLVDEGHLKTPTKVPTNYDIKLMQPAKRLIVAE